MYSLTSVPAVCYDLVRSASGVAWGDVLERALRLGPADLKDLERGGNGDRAGERLRSAAWDALTAAALPARRLSGVLPQVRRTLGGARVSSASADPQLRAVLQVLVQTPLGGLSDVLAMLRSDVFDWTWERAGGAGGEIGVQRYPIAVQIVSDALAAAYAGSSIGERERAALQARWDGWLDRQPAVTRFGPLLPSDATLGRDAAAVRALVDRVSRLAEPDLIRLQEACDAARLGGFNWPLEMHRAARTAVDTGRVRVVAMVQLAAARSLLLAGAPADSAMAGALPAITAAVAAMTVADWLDAETYARLLTPWRVAIG